MNVSGATLLTVIRALLEPDSALRRSRTLEHMSDRLEHADDLPGPSFEASRSADIERAELAQRKRLSREIDEQEERVSRLRAIMLAQGSESAPELAAAQATLSRLESRGLSDPGRGVDDSGIRLPVTADPWLREVEALTAPFRRDRAARARARAALALHGEREGTWGTAAALQYGTDFEPAPDTPIELAKRDFQRLCDALPRPWPGEEIYVPASTLRHTLFAHMLDRRRSNASWHWARAEGQLRRFGAMHDCGKSTVKSKCNACGVMHENPAHCDIQRMCRACRARLGEKRKERLTVAQSLALRAAREKRLHKGKHRFTVRHLTLTMPHAESSASVDRWLQETDGDRFAAAALRVHALFRAWRTFTLELQEWAREVQELTGERPRYYRGFEWKQCADGQGHPHFHVWMLCPYPVTKDGNGEMALAVWWSKALAKERVFIAPDRVIIGFREAHDAWISREVAKGSLELGEGKRKKPALQGAIDLGPVGKVKLQPGDRVVTVEGSERIFKYIEGWCLDDRDQDGNRIPAELAAALYQALEGRRLVATSKAFLAPLPGGCALCGELGTVRARIVHPPLGVASQALGAGRHTRDPPSPAS